MCKAAPEISAFNMEENRSFGMAIAEGKNVHEFTSNLNDAWDESRE